VNSWVFFLLFLPLACALAFVLGQRQNRVSSDQRVSELSRSYFKGLNFLLNEQSDKALEVFMQFNEPESDSVETQLALGNLFRRRGDIDRAIRLHQDLFNKPRLNIEQRSVALMELGSDYMRAGLLDRAEALYTDVLEIDGSNKISLKQLLSIYQQEHEWLKAIEIAERMRRSGDESVNTLIAQFMCELAETAHKSGNLISMHQWLDKARAADPNCVRTAYQEAHVDLAEGQWHKALQAFARVAQLEPAFIAEILPTLLKSADDTGKQTQLLELLQTWMRDDPGPSSALAAGELIRQRDGTACATEFLLKRLREKPSLRVLSRWLQSATEPLIDVSANADLVQKVLDQYIARKAAFYCDSCGFQARSLHWQCPSCKNWGSVKPVHYSQLD
jgi:lipopolysaccharide assembly protein B